MDFGDRYVCVCVCVCVCVYIYIYIYIYTVGYARTNVIVLEPRSLLHVFVLAYIEMYVH